MKKYEVGQLFQPNITRYKEETRFDFIQDGAVLMLFYNRPDPQEIEDVRSGRFEIGFCEKNGIMFMLFRFGSGPYMDAPYTAHLSKPFTFEDPEPGMGYGLTVYLVDATTGILYAIRYVGLSRDFSNRFRRAVERQKKTSFNRTEYDLKLSNIYRNYSTKDLLKYADAWCKIK
jgi:hypothetical protein